MNLIDVGNISMLVTAGLGPDHSKVIADQWRAKCAEVARLRSLLGRLVDEFGCTIDQYHKNGPDWTHKDGTEVFNVSSILDRASLIDEARAALSAADGAKP